MRTLTACVIAISLAAAPATAASLSRTVPTGVKTKIATHAALDGSCKPQHIVLKITTQPANGSVTMTQENIAQPDVTPLGGPQRCAGTVTPTVVLYYQSKPDFTGQDQFKYDRINQDDPNDRLNGEMIMTITVK